MTSVFLDLRLTLTDSCCKPRPSRHNCRKIDLSKEFYHFTIYVSLGLPNNDASRNIRCCSSCYKFCLLTKFTFDSVQVTYVDKHNTTGCLLTANSPTIRNTQTDTYNFSDLLLSVYESWALLPPYFLTLHGVSAWMIHRHNWILNELRGGKWRSPLRTWAGKIKLSSIRVLTKPQDLAEQCFGNVCVYLNYAKGFWLVEGAGVLFRLHCCTAICTYVLYYLSQ